MAERLEFAIRELGSHAYFNSNYWKGERIRDIPGEELDPPSMEWPINKKNEDDSYG
jgi:hypothetical protein